MLFACCNNALCALCIIGRGNNVIMPSAHNALGGVCSLRNNALCVLCNAQKVEGVGGENLWKMREFLLKIVENYALFVLNDWHLKLAINVPTHEFMPLRHLAPQTL